MSFSSVCQDGQTHNLSPKKNSIRTWLRFCIGLTFLFAIGMSGWTIGCGEPQPPNEKTQEPANTDAGTQDTTSVKEKDTVRETGPQKEDKVKPDTPVGPPKTIDRKWVYRIIAGVSMGGGMSSIIGARNPEKFDIIGTLGAPNDMRYLLHYINQSMLSGFCDLNKLEAMAKAGKLNSKESYCAPPAPAARYKYEFTSHYNNWHYDDAGGNWNRPKLVQVLGDLSLALGNPNYFNEKSAYWPHAKIPVDHRVHKERCKNVIRIKGVKHWRYNPDGKYDLITYCDGNTERNGIYRPDRPQEHTTPVEVVLAVDINGNGKRDYGEPVIAMAHERYDDVGTDGCANDREDGKGGCVPKGQKGPGGKDPNGDDFNPLMNPTGTEGNILYDKGEPYKDFGIDGIDGTKDYGEGDKTFTTTPGYKNFLAHSPRDLFEKMDKKQVDRLNVYIDAGIRDLFNFHITSLMLTGALKTHYPKDPKRVQLFERFSSLMPKGQQDGLFNHTAVDWSKKGQHVYVRYGNPNATKEELAKGDGDHVHGGRIVDRLFGFLSFVRHHLPDPDLEPVQVDRSTNEGAAQHFTYDSKALKTKHMYSVVLPPGYYANPKVKYPVLYFGHGYGMDGPGMANLFVVMIPSMQNGDIPKMIMVALHGGCKQMLPIPGKVGKFSEKPWGGCHRGTFYLNSKGYNKNGLQMEDAFFEVVSEVEKRYGDRIRKPEVRSYRIPR